MTGGTWLSRPLYLPLTLMARLPTLAVPSRSMVKPEPKSQPMALALVALVAEVPQAAKAAVPVDID